MSLLKTSRCVVSSGLMVAALATVGCAPAAAPTATPPAGSKPAAGAAESKPAAAATDDSGSTTGATEKSEN